ncbi:hypothetical protein GCM10022226_46810 [Sphaerisporangium flaviroseum]|uniref:Uncharacterized protein n=1 Tax=Sphaerisporangium flaviroseum TaxID=509199 RepID=A0ABP7IL84_9ACTN
MYEPDAKWLEQEVGRALDHGALAGLALALAQRTPGGVRVRHRTQRKASGDTAGNEAGREPQLPPFRVRSGVTDLVLPPGDAVYQHPGVSLRTRLGFPHTGASLPS